MSTQSCHNTTNMDSIYEPFTDLCMCVELSIIDEINTTNVSSNCVCLLHIFNDGGIGGQTS